MPLTKDRLNPRNVLICEFIEFVEVFFHSNGACSGREDSPVLKTIERAANRPRLQVVLPNVMMTALGILRSMVGRRRRQWLWIAGPKTPIDKVTGYVNERFLTSINLVSAVRVLRRSHRDLR